MTTRLITKSYDNGVSTYYRVDLSCGHHQQINFTTRVGATCTCYDCKAGVIPPRHLDVHFSPIDSRNPAFGYELVIRDGVTGEVLFRNDRNPNTGRELLGADDCLEVAKFFV